MRFQGIENQDGLSLLTQLVHALAANSDRTLTVPGILNSSPLCESLKLVGFEINRQFVRYEAGAKAS